MIGLMKWIAISLGKAKVYKIFREVYIDKNPLFTLKILLGNYIEKKVVAYTGSCTPETGILKTTVWFEVPCVGFGWIMNIFLYCNLAQVI